MARERGYCMDWRCPARVSCRWHFGRSSEYAAMRLTGYINLEMHRDPKKDSCTMYEFDRVKLWLIPKPGQITHYFGDF